MLPSVLRAFNRRASTSGDRGASARPPRLSGTRAARSSRRPRAASRSAGRAAPRRAGVPRSSPSAAASASRSGTTTTRPQRAAGPSPDGSAGPDDLEQRTRAGRRSPGGAVPPPRARGAARGPRRPAPRSCGRVRRGRRRGRPRPRRWGARRAAGGVAGARAANGRPSSGVARVDGQPSSRRCRCRVPPGARGRRRRPAAAVVVDGEAQARPGRRVDGEAQAAQRGARRHAAAGTSASRCRRARRSGRRAASSSSCVPRSAIRPPSSTTIWSASRTVESRWAMAIVVRPSAQAVERLLHGALGLGVERARRLVEDEHRRVAQDRAGDRDALLLAAGEAVAALADDGVVAVGQRRDEVVDLRGARGRLELLVGRVGPGEAQVLARSRRGRGRSPGRRRRPCAASEAKVEVAHVDAVDRDAAGRRRRTAARRGSRASSCPSRLAHDRRRRPGGHGEVDAVERRRARPAS